MKIKKEVLKKIQEDKYFSLILSLNHEVSKELREIKEEIKDLAKKINHDTGYIDLEKLSKKVERLTHYKKFPVSRENTKANKIRKFLKDNNSVFWCPKELMKKTNLCYNTLMANLKYMVKVRKEITTKKVNGRVWFKWKGN